MSYGWKRMLRDVFTDSLPINGHMFHSIIDYNVWILIEVAHGRQEVEYRVEYNAQQDAAM
jgi:hypothetical protein